MMRGLKDEQLDRLAEVGNVAQFASFGPTDDPNPPARFLRIAGLTSLQPLVGAVTSLLAGSTSGAVNIRTFTPDTTRKGNPFVYGLTSVNEAVVQARAFLEAGYYVIVNELVDVTDGGCSGVVLGDTIEFAPDDTPRAVEKPGVASLPRGLGQAVLGAVYPCGPELAQIPSGHRTEFSVHPDRVGFKRGHVLLWEQYSDHSEVSAQPSWPNRFSRHLGDKAYGLLLAHALGFPVPRSTVVARRVQPFVFGIGTGTGDVWLRTAPAVQTPGNFTTTNRWTDPFLLLASEDPDGVLIASVLAQEGVDAIASGATMYDESGNVVVEGVLGVGDAFMLGQQAPESLPDSIVAEVKRVVEELAAILGPVTIEWARDCETVWLLQVHWVEGTSTPRAGEPDRWISYAAGEPLDLLSLRIKEAQAFGLGVTVHGSVGQTSHVGELLRMGQIPWRVVPKVGE